MTRHTLQVGIDDVWRALDQIDPVDALVDELVEGPPASQRLVPWPDPAVDLVMIEDLGTGQACVLPAEALRALGIAARCALAARTLLGRVVVTAGVIGSGLTAQFVLGVLARHVPGVSHVALNADVRPEPRVVDQLDLAGIGLTAARSAAQATRGANLVVMHGPTAPELRIGQLSRRAVLVNATGTDLPDELVDRIERIYVSDASALSLNLGRHFVRAHLARHGQPGIGQVAGDFRSLLQGRPGPVRADDVVLVEVLDPDALDATMANRLHVAARRAGLGGSADRSTGHPNTQ